MKNLIFSTLNLSLLKRYRYFSNKLPILIINPLDKINSPFSHERDLMNYLNKIKKQLLNIFLRREKLGFKYVVCTKINGNVSINKRFTVQVDNSILCHDNPVTIKLISSYLAFKKKMLQNVHYSAFLKRS